MIAAKLRALGNPLPETQAHLVILKIVGLQEYLFRNNFPLYFYACVSRAARLQENLPLILHAVSEEEHGKLLPLRTSKVSSVVNAYEEQYGPHTFNTALRSAQERNPVTIKPKRKPAPKLQRNDSESDGSGSPSPESFDINAEEFDEDDVEEDDERMLEKDSASSLFYVRVHGIQFPLLNAGAAAATVTSTAGSRGANSAAGIGHYIPPGFDNFHVEVSLYYNGEAVMESPIHTSSVVIPQHVVALNAAVAASNTVPSASNASSVSISANSTDSVRIGDVHIAVPAQSSRVGPLVATSTSTCGHVVALLTQPLDIRIPGGALSTSISFANIPETTRVVFRLMGNVMNTFGPPTSVEIAVASVPVFDHRNVLNCSKYALNDCLHLKHGLGKRGCIVPLFESAVTDRTVEVSSPTSPGSGRDGSKDRSSYSGSGSGGRERDNNSNELDAEDEEDDDEDITGASNDSPSKKKKARREKPKKMPPYNHGTLPAGTNCSINSKAASNAAGPIALIVSFDWPTPGKLIKCSHRCLLSVENEAMARSSSSLTQVNMQTHVHRPTLATVEEGNNNNGADDEDNDNEGEGSGDLGPIRDVAFTVGSSPSPSSSPGSGAPSARSNGRRGNISSLRQRRNISVISKRAAAPTKEPTQREWILLDRIDRLDPLAELEPDLAMLLWDCRKSCASRPSLLVKFLKSVWWTSATAAGEARKMLLQWQPCLPVEALELLDIRYPYATVPCFFY
jgi:hypothetical protein